MDDMTGWLVGIDHMTGRMGVMNDMTDWLVGIDHMTGRMGVMDDMTGRIGVMHDMTDWLVGIDHMTGRMGVTDDMTDWLVGIDHTTGRVDGCSFFLSVLFLCHFPPSLLPLPHPTPRPPYRLILELFLIGLTILVFL